MPRKAKRNKADSSLKLVMENRSSICSLPASGQTGGQVFAWGRRTDPHTRRPGKLGRSMLRPYKTTPRAPPRWWCDGPVLWAGLVVVFGMVGDELGGGVKRRAAQSKGLSPENVEMGERIAAGCQKADPRCARDDRLEESGAKGGSHWRTWGRGKKNGKRRGAERRSGSILRECGVRKADPSLRSG
jgi:hypothetical protein